MSLRSTRDGAALFPDEDNKLMVNDESLRECRHLGAGILWLLVVLEFVKRLFAPH